MNQYLVTELNHFPVSFILESTKMMNYQIDFREFPKIFYILCFIVHSLFI